MSDATQPTPLPPLPGCGRRATTHLHIHSRTGDVYTLDGEIVVCDEHAPIAVDTIGAAGLLSHRATMAAPGHCGDGYDFVARGPFLGPVVVVDADVVADGFAALTAFSDGLDLESAVKLLSLWRHNRDLNAAERAAILAHFSGGAR